MWLAVFSTVGVQEGRDAAPTRRSLADLNVAGNLCARFDLRVTQAGVKPGLIARVWAFWHVHPLAKPGNMQESLATARFSGLEVCMELLRHHCILLFACPSRAETIKGHADM